MRSKLVLAGLAVGVAASFLPIAPASAQCDPVLVGDGGGCSNGCMEAGRTWNGAQEKALGKVVVDYWSIFLCTQ